MTWWLARGEDAVPPELDWLATGEAARAQALRYPKRRAEYLLRRLVAKHAVARLTGRAMDAAALAGIEVRNAPSGAPYAVVDGAPLGLDLSITDRAGWAVCVLGGQRPGGGDPGRSGWTPPRPAVGCDLELVEPRSPGFVRDYLTGAERRFVEAQPPGDARDAAANLMWSAKESALKALRTGLRRDTRSVEVSAAPPGPDGWGALTIHVDGDTSYPGWWRRAGRFVLTVCTVDPGPPPVALDDPSALATAEPRHTWLGQPVRRP